MEAPKAQGLIGEEEPAPFVVPGADEPVDLTEEDDEAEADDHAEEVKAAEEAGDAGDEGEDWEEEKDVTPDMSADDPTPKEDAE